MNELADLADPTATLRRRLNTLEMAGWGKAPEANALRAVLPVLDRYQESIEFGRSIADNPRHRARLLALIDPNRPRCETCKQRLPIEAAE
jgi:hypothetical protein